MINVRTPENMIPGFLGIVTGWTLPVPFGEFVEPMEGWQTLMNQFCKVDPPNNPLVESLPVCFPMSGPHDLIRPLVALLNVPP
jgi:hypothetical protein